MAIDDLLDEHEQGERVRGWLRENGSGVLTGILLGLALILGWQWWMQQRAHQRVQAGDDYQAAVEALQSGKADVARARIAAASGASFAPASSATASFGLPASTSNRPRRCRTTPASAASSTSSARNVAMASSRLPASSCDFASAIAPSTA